MEPQSSTPATVTNCACGAIYARESVTLPIKDVGIFECQCCGEELERWQGRTVPRFKLLLGPPSQRREAV